MEVLHAVGAFFDARGEVSRADFGAVLGEFNFLFPRAMLAGAQLGGG